MRQFVNQEARIGVSPEDAPRKEPADAIVLGQTPRGNPACGGTAGDGSRLRHSHRGVALAMVDPAYEICRHLVDVAAESLDLLNLLQFGWDTGLSIGIQEHRSDTYASLE